MSAASNLSRTGFFLSWLLLLAGLLVEVIVPGSTQRFRTLPFLLSIVLFGLPHGAADLMLLQTHTKTVGWTTLLARFGSYLILMCGALVCLLVFPKTLLAVFLVLSAWHFGISDVHDLRLLGHHERSRWRALLRAGSRGALLLTLPLAANPQESLRIASDWMEILRPASSQVILREETLAALAMVVAGLALATSLALVGDRFRRGHTATAFVEAVETALLVMILVRLDPLFAVGLYFLACHSWRHVVKLMAIWSDGDVAHPWWTGLKTVYVRSLPLLVPTVAVLGTLGAWTVQWQPDKLATLVLMVFAVVTLSHHLLVDRILGLDDIGSESA